MNITATPIGASTGASVGPLAATVNGALTISIPCCRHSQTGEPIFRRSIMRLGFPRIKSLHTDDGTASIDFQSTSMDRDTGGFEYLFRFATSSGEAEVH